MRLMELMTKFGERFGLGQVEPRMDGSYALTVDDDTTVTIEELDDEGAIFVSSVLGDFGDMGAEAAASLLSANMRLRENGGAFAGLDEDSDEVVLVMRLEAAALDVDTFEARLQAFLDHRADLVGDLDEAEEAGSEPVDMSAEAGMEVFRL